MRILSKCTQSSHAQLCARAHTIFPRTSYPNACAHAHCPPCWSHLRYPTQNLCCVLWCSFRPIIMWHSVIFNFCQYILYSNSLNLHSFYSVFNFSNSTYLTLKSFSEVLACHLFTFLFDQCIRPCYLQTMFTIRLFMTKASKEGALIAPLMQSPTNW